MEIATFNPQTIYITPHAAARWLHRYEESLHVPYTAADKARAREAMREQLMLCFTQDPPVWRDSLGKLGRQYIVNDLIFVLSEDRTAVITFYWDRRHAHSKRYSKEKRKKDKKQRLAAKKHL